MMRLAPPLVMALLPLASACGQVVVPVDAASCLAFDLSTLPPGSFDVVDTSSYHTPYTVSSPCVSAPTSRCANANTVAASPAYALVGASPNTRCYSLGGAAGAGGVLPPGTETAALPSQGGLRVSVQGGEGGRNLIYNLVCNATAPPSQGPEARAAHSGLTYPFTWRHPAGCGTRLTGSQCPAPPKQPVPLPTKAQLAYQNAEIVAIVCFQMDTYAANDGDPGCNAGNWATGINTSSPATYNPSRLNVSQWVAVSQSMGAKYAWLTAKHGCGFLLWPTKTKLPGGRPYGYDVGAPDAGSHVDVVKEWMQQLRRAGIGPGLYYSLKDNFYLNAAAHGLVRPGPLLPGQERVVERHSANQAAPLS